MAQTTPTYCFVLVRVDAGSTQEILIAHGATLDAMMRVVDSLWTSAMLEVVEGPDAMEYQHALGAERDALLAMLARHPLCVPGRYILPPLEPIWEQCTLVIAAQDGGWVPA